MHVFDIVIVGGGIVGLTQALALKNSGLSVAVVESHVSEAMPSGDPDDEHFERCVDWMDDKIFCYNNIVSRYKSAWRRIFAKFIMKGK